MVDQQKADDFAEFIGVNGYGARIPVGDKDIVITCDGVGTKLYLADHFKKWDTVGVDLVAMSVNDLLCCGAEPLAFMDYYAVEELDITKSKEIIGGIKYGCFLSDIDLVGGETAQLEGMFKTSDSFDLAGFAVGEVVKPMRDPVELHDFVVGIPSSGLHSNGFTFLREKMKGTSLQLEEWMLEPTRIYTKEILNNLDKIKRCAHVTGGGIDRALGRLVNQPFTGLVYDDALNKGRWEEIQTVLNLNNTQMKSNFNCGWGMLLVTNTPDLDIPDAEVIGFLSERTA